MTPPPDLHGPDEAQSPAPSSNPILLYDGDCGFCQRSVRWIMRRERDEAILFAPLTGTTAHALRQRYPAIPEVGDSIVYVADGKVWRRTHAVMRLAIHLRAPWRWLHALRWMPAWLVDLPYRLIARFRHRLAPSCERPSERQRHRYLD